MDNIYFSGNDDKPSKKIINKSSQGNKSNKKPPKRKPKRSANRNQPKDIKFSNNNPKRPIENANIKTEKRNKRNVLILSIVSFFVVVGLILAIAYGILTRFFGDIQFKKRTDNPFVSQKELLSDKQTTNILLLGADNYTKQSSGRTDTMMLVSVNEKTKEIKLVSFLRDTYLTIPGHEKTRLNHAYMYGKAPLVINTIEYNYNIDIDNYVLVDFDVFKKVVDTIGGVDVPITQKEANALNSQFRADGPFYAGDSVHLDGKKALAFSRIRYLDSDFKRTNRQRLVVNAVINKAKNIDDKNKIVEMAKVIMPMVETDMTPVQISRLAFVMRKDFNFNVDSIGIPAENAYESKTINGMAVLVPDLEKNKQILKDTLYGSNNNTEKSQSEFDPDEYRD
ncbi:MAG: LCP family protein [Clostridia bacterium]|nr:LCP family protein [Clostridia bacterium]